MDQLDFKKALKHLFSASANKAAIVEVPECQYLMVDGEGDPKNNPHFSQAMQTLYGILYGLKMGWKFEKLERPHGYVDFTVAPPEALWWMADGGVFDIAQRSDWRWTQLIMMPDFATKEMVYAVAAEVRHKKGEASIAPYRFERWEEGTCVQIMHLGTYDAEAPALEKMHRFAKENGYEMHGKHHEIYLSDPRRTAPEKIKTILRHPVRKG
jgi:hypothetical protein